jgi:peptidoglycan/LPS O-acetylase OafA/YrhL
VTIIVAAGAALALTPMAVGLELPRIVFVLGLSVLMFYVWRWSEPLTRLVAGYSYTLYLTHFPILIFAYALLVAGAGETTPSLTARAAAALLGIAAALFCSLLAARGLEDTASIRMILLAVLGRAQRPA